MKKIFGLLFGSLITMSPVFAKSYVTETLLFDEVNITFKAKTSNLDVYQTPQLSAKRYQIKVKPKQILAFDQAKVMIQPVMITTRQAIMLSCDKNFESIRENSQKINIAANQQIGYVHPLIPDGAVVIYQNQECMLDELNPQHFLGFQEPNAEKWIRLVDKQKKFLGWLFLNAKKLRDYGNTQITYRMVTYSGEVLH